MMGSPESENWRIEDEAQHEVAVSSFYADPYEATQADYEKLMGTKPSTFTGERLPVENISWLDAVRYANAKSEAAGLAPAYIWVIRALILSWRNGTGVNHWLLSTLAEQEEDRKT